MEIAALVVSVVGLLLQGLSSRRDFVKDDQSAVRGMVGLYLKLNAWRTRGEETNREFHAWLSPLLDSAAAKTPDEIRSRFAQLPFAMEWALYSQVHVLEDIWAGDEGNYEAVAALIEAYVPTGADGFRLGMALQQRKDLVSQLVEKVPDTYARKGIDGVAALVGQADDTLRMLTQATTQLQVFIREQVSVEDFQRVASRFGEKPYPAL